MAPQARDRLIHEAIDEATQKSKVTCERCASPGELKVYHFDICTDTTGWSSISLALAPFTPCSKSKNPYPVIEI
jgi:hypothetical protein